MDKNDEKNPFETLCPDAWLPFNTFKMYEFKKQFNHFRMLSNESDEIILLDNHITQINKFWVYTCIHIPGMYVYSV